MLKGQDILIALLLASNQEKNWTQASIAKELEISVGDVNNSLKRGREAGLLMSKTRKSNLVLYIRPEKLSGSAKRLLGIGSDELKQISRPQIKTGALEELLVHGIKYFFPPKWSEVTRGIPTAHAAPIITEIIASNETIPVWEHPQGTARGVSFAPIHKSCASASLKNPALYELLALADVFRIGRNREVGIAQELLRRRLRGEK